MDTSSREYLESLMVEAKDEALQARLQKEKLPATFEVHLKLHAGTVFFNRVTRIRISGDGPEATLILQDKDRVLGVIDLANPYILIEYMRKGSDANNYKTDYLDIDVKYTR